VELLETRGCNPIPERDAPVEEDREEEEGEEEEGNRRCGSVSHIISTEIPNTNNTAETTARNT
jgi:hypothetical protein